MSLNHYSDEELLEELFRRIPDIQKNDGDIHKKDSVVHHREICNLLNDIYAQKNHDYGDSFHLMFWEEGMAMARIRLGDKFNRFKTLTTCDDEWAVSDESIRDTLLDLANYAIMTVMELDKLCGESVNEH